MTDNGASFRRKEAPFVCSPTNLRLTNSFLEIILLKRFSERLQVKILRAKPDPMKEYRPSFLVGLLVWIFRLISKK